MAVTNEVGNRYGRLVVLSRAGSDAHRNALWLCQCDCGNQKIVSGFHMRHGFTKSCGCLNKENCINMGYANGIDISGQKFGLLTALYPTEARAYDNSVIWHCECECGNFHDTSIKCLKNGYTISCGCKSLSKGEILIRDILIKSNIKFQYQKTFEDFKSEKNRYYRYDFFLNELNILIEYDGAQHSEQVEFFDNDLEKQKQVDKIKNLYALEHGYQLYRIPYTVYNKLNQISDILSEKFRIKI